MKNHDHEGQAVVLPAKPSRRARLQALLFTGAALGTTLLTLGILAEGKLPRAQSE